MPQIDFHRVRDKRDELGLRNTRIAEGLGIQTPSVENIMCGNADPSMRVVHGLSRLLGLPVDQIVLSGDRTPQGDPSEPPVQPPTSPTGPPRRQQKEQRTGPKRATSAVA